jgi:PAS domain S-box-containing protein
MATENKSTLHKSVKQKSKKPSRGTRSSLYDVLPSLSIEEDQAGRRKSDEYLKLFQHLINQSNDAIFIVDPENGHYIDVNQKACISLGYTYEELLTMGVMDVQELLPDIESWREHVAKVCNAGSLVTEGVHKRKEGTLFPVEASIKYVTHEKINYMIAFVRDITDRKKTEEDLRKSEARFRTLTASSPMAVFQTDRNGRCVYINDRFRELSGLPGAPVKTGDWLNALHPDDVEQVSAAWRKSIDMKEKFDMEYRFQHPEGKVIWVGALAEPLFNDAGDIVGFIGTLSDITERKKDAEKAFRANQLASIGELAAGVAHEINNPINGIINYAQILENRSEPLSREWDICSRIIKEGDRIAYIVSSLLSFAREGGEEKVATNICDILCNTLDLINMPLRKDNIMVNVTMPSHTGLVYARPEQLRQVFLNIISNARYSLNQAYPVSHENKTLDIYCEEQNEGGHVLVRIVFHDRGTGIPETMLKKVMNPFFTTKPGPDGTGLGLSISHSIITEHGGELYIESKEAEFTKVIVELPGKIKDH